MKRFLANVGYFCVVVVIIIVSVVSLASTSGGRMTLGIIVGIVGIVVVVCIPHYVRIWRARKVFRNLPKEVKEQVLDLIQAAAAKNPCVTYLLLDDNMPCFESEIAILSHVGGRPYAEEGETWPVHADSVPPRFLLQVRLDEPSLGERWQERLIAVFLVSDAEQIVRSYAVPTLEKYVPIASPVTPFSCIRLRSLPFPVVSEDDPIPMSPEQLRDNIPEIKELLALFTSDSSGLLSQIIRRNLHGYDLEAPDIAYQGGSPMLIQNPHDPECDHCHQAMRFLFQFGEIIPGLQLADAGVGYVYGCDDHPDHCKAFIDSH
jgi:uncharacterized membrane protein (DUF485 family)